MSVYSLSAIGRAALRRVRRLLQRLRSDAENTYSPAASLAMLLAVGIIVVTFH